MASFDIVKARLSAFFVESVFLGAYLVSFAYTVVALVTKGAKWRKPSEINYPMVIVVLLMLYNASMNSATSVVIFWRAFVLNPPGGAVESFEQITYWAVVMKTAVLVFQITVGDGMLIYRCWVLYHKSLLPVTFSIVLWLGGTACAIALVYFESTSKTHALVDASALYPFTVSFWVSTLVLNVVTTVLLLFPIWKAARNIEKFGYSQSGRRNRMSLIMHVVLESGLLYTTVAFMTFVTYTAKHNSLYIISCALVPIAGIAFNLIIIRTSKAVHKSDTTSTRSGTLSTLIGNRPQGFRTGTNKRVKGAVDDESRGHVKVLVSQDMSWTRDESYPLENVGSVKSAENGMAA